MQINSPFIVFVVGPTAVGKTDIAFHLAQTLNAEIVSCDAMQVYREVNVVNEKPPSWMRDKVPHHLIDVVSVQESFDVSVFNRLAVAAVQDIHSRGKPAVIAGGSGMYMQVLLDGLFEGEHKDPELRRRLEERAVKEGAAVLYEELKQADPLAADRIHPNDQRRVIRALEVFSLTEQPISSLQKIRKGLWGTVPIQLFALNRSRPELYQRINLRVDRMLEGGLVEEVEFLRQKELSQTAKEMLGLPEIIRYLDGECDLSEAGEQLKMNTRRFAKRQLTWFRREDRLEWVELKNEDQAKDVAGRLVKLIEPVS